MIVDGKVPDLSRCVILSLRSEVVLEPNQYDPSDPFGHLIEVFTLDYLNPMGFYTTHTWYEERD
jgi:hypothetical protein